MARYIDAEDFAKRLAMEVYMAEDEDFTQAFVKGMQLVKKAEDETPTADVVPRVEYEELIYKLECLLCCASGSKLSKHTYDLKTMETVVNDYINESYYDGAKDTAKEIFAEICSVEHEGGFVVLTARELAELKKKYVEGKTDE